MRAQAIVRTVGIALLLLASPAAADTIAGRASVIDGDTIEIEGERVQILDVDAPENWKKCYWDIGWSEWFAWPCGQQAKLALADWIGHRTVTCEAIERDHDMQWHARCSVDGRDVAEWLAANGWAQPRQYCMCAIFELAAERDCMCAIFEAAAERAKAAHLGIWAKAPIYVPKAN